MVSSAYGTILTLLTLYYLLLHIPLTKAVVECRDCEKAVRWYRDGVRELSLVTVISVVGMGVLAFFGSLEPMVAVDVVAFIVVTAVFNLVVVRSKVKVCSKFHGSG